MRTTLLVAFLTATVTVELAARTRGKTAKAAGWPVDRWSRFTAAAGGAVAILVSAAGDAIDRVTGVDNLGMLTGHLVGIVSVAGICSLMLAWTYPPSARPAALRLRLAGALAVAAAAIAMFVTVDHNGIDLTNEYAHVEGVAEYLLIINLYWAVTGIAVARDCIPLAIDNARAGHRRIATAQALIAAGGAASAVWGITEGAFAAITRIWGNAWNVGVQDTISSTSAGLFGACIFSGIAACSIPTRVERAR
ncbi:hypothetical protein ACFV4P_02415 [Kitasatospora sp. NPDC059795]|uniref:hypothetical protein n=1 Tax=Kitasatospora sp. NPDC059795 TaxID=3346949 RepID=UPI003667CB7E